MEKIMMLKQKIKDILAENTNNGAFEEYNKSYFYVDVKKVETEINDAIDEIYNPDAKA